MIGRFAVEVDGQEIELSTLDWTSNQEDRRGGILVRLQLWHSQSRFTERLPVPGKPGMYADGERYLSVLAKPLLMQVRLDLSGLHALARKAARAKSGRAKSGIVTVRGGQRAVWRREPIK